MSLHRRNPRRDQNEPEIIAALEAAGCSVEPISRRGVPDLLIGFNGLLWLAEVKHGQKNLTPDQVAWWASWRGPKPILLRSVEDALQLVRWGRI